MKTNESLIAPRSDLGTQLDHLLIACWRPAHWATRIWRPSELPLHLERSVRTLPPNVEWRAYTDDSQTYCAIGRAASGMSYEPPATALEVFFLDGGASVYAAGVWEFGCERGWTVYAVPDIEATWSRGILSLLEPHAPILKALGYAGRFSKVCS